MDFSPELLSEYCNFYYFYAQYQLPVVACRVVVTVTLSVLSTRVDILVDTSANIAVVSVASLLVSFVVCISILGLVVAAGISLIASSVVNIAVIMHENMNKSTWFVYKYKIQTPLDNTSKGVHQ